MTPAATRPATIDRPQSHEYGEFYSRYIAAVPDGDVLELMYGQGRELARLLDGLTEEQSLFRYAPGKWSVKEIAGHLADGERVFAYRALRIGRGDTTPLPGFEQDDYVAKTDFDALPMRQLVTELTATRAATISLFRTFSADALSRMGTASGFPVSVRALAWMIAGHERHHMNVLRERYLQPD